MLFMRRLSFFLFFFFNDTATTEIYTLSLHDALPISVPNSAAPTSSPPALLFTVRCLSGMCNGSLPVLTGSLNWAAQPSKGASEHRQRTVTHTGKRSEEHTSELQSRLHLGCRPLLEKKQN